MRTRRAALSLIFCLGLLTPHTGAAAATPEAKQAAQDLANKSLEALRRGEDAPDDTQKMAAYEEGLDLAKKAVALDEENADAHFGVFGNQGRILLLQGVGANPISLLMVNGDLERALELNPDHADALTAKGGLYRQLPRLLGGSQTVAEECLTKAIRLDPEAVSARIELAALYREMGHPERCAPLLKTAAEIAERQGKKRQLREANELLRELEPTPH